MFLQTKSMLLRTIKKHGIDVARLEFAVWFAQVNLAELRDGEWALLCEDVEFFLSGRPTQRGIAAAECCEVASDFDFQSLQRRTLVILQHRAHGEWHKETRLSVQLQFYPDYIGVEGSTDDCFLTLLAFLLLNDAPDRVRACLECTRLFCRVKQQTYCSHTCGSRVAQRRFRERHGLR